MKRTGKSRESCVGQKIRLGIRTSSEWQGISAKDVAVWIAQGLLLVFAISYLFYDSMVFAIFICPYLYLHVKRRAEQKRAEEKKRLSLGFKDGMVAVSFGLNAGYSIENSFKEAVRELTLLYGSNAYIVRVFKEMNRRMDNNENAEEVLKDFAVRSGVEDITYFADVFSYAKRSGGDLMLIIKNTANTIRDKLEVDNQIQTELSGKKLEAKIMTAVPFIMIMYLRLTSPDFLTCLYHNVFGIVFMTICLVVIGLMSVVIGRIVDIKI